MKTVFAIIFAFTALVAFSQNTATPQSKGSAATYEVRVAELESKIKRLEDRIRSLEIKEQQSRTVEVTPSISLEGNPKVYK